MKGAKGLVLEVAAYARVFSIVSSWDSDFDARDLAGLRRASVPASRTPPAKLTQLAQLHWKN